MWLVGVVIRMYIDILIIIINFPYSTCIRPFLAAASLLLCSFKNVFSVFIYSNTAIVLNFADFPKNASFKSYGVIICPPRAVPAS